MPGFEVGDLFADRYEVLEHLGHGGMGVVYLVKDWRALEERALKTLLPKYAENVQAVRRFAREVNAARRLEHPCVVKIYDSGHIDGTLYYTMEYLRGKSVRAWLRERKKIGKGPLGLGSTVRILGMLCHALEHAHKFTIHRDLSPENVMVMPNGDVKLLDFGLAKLTSTDQDLTRIGVSLGKIQYCAPEQRVDAKSVDLRADIYSLGIMFHELLSGELPEDGLPLTQRVPALPPEADALFLRATAHDPADRFDSAPEFLQALKLVYQQARAAIDGVSPPVRIATDWPATSGLDAVTPGAATPGTPIPLSDRFKRLMRRLSRLGRARKTS